MKLGPAPKKNAEVPEPFEYVSSNVGLEEINHVILTPVNGALAFSSPTKSF